MVIGGASGCRNSVEQQSGKKIWRQVRKSGSGGVWRLMRIGFLLPRDDVHHVAHMVPVAASLAELRPDWTISIVSRSFRTARGVDRNLPLARRNLFHWRVGRSPERDEVAGGISVGHDRDVIAMLDAIVTSEPDAARVRKGNGRDVPVIYMRPGASELSGLDRRVAGFDHILVQGQKLRDRLAEAATVPSDRITIIGCPKFDEPLQPPAPKNDDRRTILYNPHYAPELSSWYRWGPAILDWFIEHPDYRLIFAPHIRLFDRKRVHLRGRLLPQRVHRIEPRWVQAPNIHVDLGSSASTTRAYTELADIYLGDAGAQLYEFIHRPRPCGFLDAHGLASAGGPLRFGWGAGIVIDKLPLFGDLLRTAQEWHAEVHASVQREMFDYSISVTDIPARQRAAQAIISVASN